MCIQKVEDIRSNLQYQDMDNYLYIYKSLNGKTVDVKNPF